MAKDTWLLVLSSSSRAEKAQSFERWVKKRVGFNQVNKYACNYVF